MQGTHDVGEREDFRLRQRRSTERQQSEQALIEEQMNALLAEVQFDIAYSDLQNAFAAVFSAIGIDPAPPVPDDISVEELAKVLEAHWGIL